MEEQVSNRWIAGLVMTSIFILGALAGGGAVAILIRVPTPPAAPFPFPTRRPGGAPFAQPSGRGEFGTDFVVFLSRELRLSDQQRDSIQSIFDRQRRDTDQTLESLAPRLRARIDSTNAQIRRVLDERQRARFEEIQQRLRSGRPGQRGLPPPGVIR